MDLDVIAADTAYLAKDYISKHLVVHCDTKLLVAIHKAEQEKPSLSKAFTYIGVSKLSCNGCDCFFRAFNCIHTTAWYTKGSHGKSYHPWQFPPQAFPKRDAVLKWTYGIIVNQWAKSYNGYRHKYVPVVPDSTAQSAPSNPWLDSEDEGEYADLLSELEEQFKGGGFN
jgi:hypothetical protein